VPVDQRLATLMLRKLQCAVDVAGHGREAVAVFAAARYDCILMDCQTPDLDGFDATREIRRHEAGRGHVPIIAVHGQRPGR